MPVQPTPLITLTTDFGTRDWFVGTMKGVIACLSPGAQVVDLTHDISPGDLRAAGFALLAGYGYFPKGTIHVVVVDPGVGTSRKALAIQTQNYFFVGPDNGVVSWALTREKIKAIHALENRDYLLEPISQTFHGRDIFAPAAAHLSAGVSVRALGPKLKRYVRIHWPPPRLQADGIQGEVLYLDRFGNAITNIERSTMCSWRGRPLRVWRGGHEICSLKPAYGSVAPGRPLAVLGSSGFLEIAINGGSAAQVFGLRVGSKICLRAANGRRKLGTFDLCLVSARARA